jgi:hypothetical protein
MSLSRRNPRRDKAERPIIDALRACGFSVEPLSRKGCGDLLLGRQGITRVAEVKTDDEPLNVDQREWWGAWRGNGCIVLRTPGDAVTLSTYWTLLDPRLLQKLA